jgi:hypothetical protein
MTTWTKTTDAAGWTKHTRGACSITESPDGQVMLFALGCTSMHANISAAKRAALGCRARGW